MHISTLSQLIMKQASKSWMRNLNFRIPFQCFPDDYEKLKEDNERFIATNKSISSSLHRLQVAATESQWMVNSLELEISTKDDTINTLQREVDYLNVSF